MGDLGDGEDVDEVEEELGRRRLLAVAVARPQVRDDPPRRWGLSDRGGDLPILRRGLTAAPADTFAR
jgi:hypothetical protein